MGVTWYDPLSILEQALNAVAQDGDLADVETDCEVAVE
jgi:hypothetical protein